MRTRLVALVTLILICSATRILAQNGNDLFQQGLDKERGAGDIPAAIKIYERIVKDFAATNRLLVAKSLIQLGGCYEKLGQDQASRNLYDEVVRSYSDQREQVAIARARLAAVGEIRGTVTGSDTSQPIAGAQLTIKPAPFVEDAAFERLLSALGRKLDRTEVQDLMDIAARGLTIGNPNQTSALLKFQSANESRFTATSDSAGRFTIKDVPPGQYTIHARLAGSFDVPTAVRVSAGQRSDAALSMYAGGVISGRVSNAAGAPQFDASIQALAITYQFGFKTLRKVLPAVKVDDRGEYRLFPVPPGEYLIAATPQEAISREQERPVRTFYPAAVDTQTAVPVVIRIGERELSGMNIGVRTAATLRVSADIHAVLPADADSRTPVRAYLGRRIRDPNKPDDIGETSGTGPADLGNLILQPGDGRFSGHFETDGFLPGNYELVVMVAAGGITNFAHIPIDVNGQDIAGLTIDVHPSVPLSGTVVVDGHGPGTVPVRISRQSADSVMKNPAYQGMAANFETANRLTGSFTFKSTPPGHFRIALGSLPPGLYFADVLQGGASVFDSGFDVGVEPPSPLQVILKSGAGKVEGIARDTTGKPVAGATAVLVPSEPRRQNQALYRIGITDSAGRFTIQGITPGNYKLFAWQKVQDGAYYNADFLANLEELGRPVTVGQAATSAADVRVIP